MSALEAGTKRAAADPRAFLLRLFETAVAAASPWDQLARRLPPPPQGRTVVLGTGKAAAAMARAVDRGWGGPLEGLVVTRYGHGLPCERIEVVEAAHPVPDAAGQAAAARILDLARGLAAEDLLVCVVSGGGSALLALPVPGLTLEDKQAVTTALLRSGATIAEVNCVRKHLSAVKGGRLAAAAHPAPVITYLVSDVPGDDPAVVASGPTLPDPTTFADALATLVRYHIAEPPGVVAHLQAGTAGERLAANEFSTTALPAGAPTGVPAETPKPGDPSFAGDQVIVLATADDALIAAAAAAREFGVTPVVLGDAVEGEAGVAAGDHARLALACASGGGPATPPCVLLSGGETTVTVRGAGRGGRNTEYLLALAVACGGHPRIHAIACDTDGIDGTEDAAGAHAGPDTLARARAGDLNLSALLADNDSYGAFAALGDLVVTGPTRTNVNDFRAILVV